MDQAGPGQEFQIFTSAITFAEILTGPLKRLRADSSDHDAERIIGLYSSLLDGRAPSSSDLARIEVVDLLPGVSWIAAEIRALRPSLKLPDAIHLGSAQWSQCDAILSSDIGLLAAGKTAGFLSVSFDPDDLDALLARIAAAP